MTTTYLTNPSDVFRCFAEAYWALDPGAPISYQMGERLCRVIDDICAGNEISEFKKGSSFELISGLRVGETVCSIWFIHYISMLQFAATEQKQYRISPTRAAALLFGFSQFVRDAEQSVMRLTTRRGRFELVSRRKFLEQYGIKMRLLLGGPSEAPNWDSVAGGWGAHPREWPLFRHEGLGGADSSRRE